MAVVEAASSTVSLLRDEPRIALLSGVVGVVTAALVGGTLFSIPGEIVRYLQLASFVILPFLWAGVYGCIAELAETGEFSGQAFTTSLMRRGPPLVGAYLLTGLTVAGIAALGLLSLIFPLISVLGVVVLPCIAVILIFLDVTIVLGQRGPIGGVWQAVALVRQNIESVLGYLLIRVVLTLLLGYPVLWSYVVADTDSSLAIVSAIGGVVLVAAVSAVFHVQFYREITPVEAPAEVDTADDVRG